MGKITIDELSNELKERINELGLTEEQVQQLIDNTSGDKSQLQTNAKGSLVDAINELFQSANNGKELIATAIGEPLNSSDTFSAMSTNINGLLSTFKANMMNNGVSVAGTDKFKQLIDKLATLADSEGKGIQYANGTLNNIQLNDVSNNISLNLGIDFTPTLLVINIDGFITGNLTYTGKTTINNLIHNSSSNICMLFGGLTSAVEADYAVGYAYITSSNNLYVYNRYTGSGNSGDVYLTGISWEAVGVGEEDTTLEDSLRDILGNKGVEVSPEDDLASLISKVDSIKMGDCTNQDLISVLNNTGYKETKDLTLVSLASDNVNMDTSYHSIYTLWGNGRIYPLAILNVYDKYTLGTFKPKINFSKYDKIKLRAASNIGNQVGNILMMTNYVASTGTSSSTSATYRTTVNLTTSVTTCEINISSWTGEGYLAIEMPPYGDGNGWAFMIESIELIANDNGLNGNETTEQLLSKLNTLSQPPRLTSGTMVTLDNPCLVIGTSGTYYHTYTHKAPSGTILFSVYIDQYRYTTNVTVVHKRNGVTLSSTKFEMVREYDSSYGDYKAVNQYKDYDIQTGDTIEFTFVKGSASGDRIDLALLSADIYW